MKSGIAPMTPCVQSKPVTIAFQTCQIRKGAYYAPQFRPGE
jgi:hypothetical protein